MSVHAFASVPDQVDHLRHAYPGIRNHGLWGLDGGWDVVVSVWQAEGYDASYLGHDHCTLSFVLAGAETERMDGPFAGRCAGPDHETFMLYADGGSRRYVARGRIEVCQIYFQRSFIGMLAQTDFATDRAELRDDRVIAQDRELRQLAGALLGRARSGPLAPAIEIDSYAVLLGLHLLRRHSNCARDLPAVRGLDRRRLGAVLELVESRLGGALRLADMAAVAGLSPSHFSTAFRLATGRAPHAFLLDRRVERAKERLAAGDPIAEVAHVCGFSSQQHLSTLFRRSTGSTPGAWRDAHAPYRRRTGRALPQDREQGP